MANRHRSPPADLLRDIATFEILHNHGVTVRKMATALQVSKQTVYRRMQAVLNTARQLHAEHPVIGTHPYDHHTQKQPDPDQADPHHRQLEDPPPHGS